MLVDDDSDDSLGEYSPSPINPIVKKDEPTDLFARMAAQMEQEEADQFNLVKHQAEPGEEVFSAIGDIKADTSAAHSTPIEKESKSAVSKYSKESKGKKKKHNPPAADIFNLLMANDEPEYAVDDTLPANSKLIPPPDETESKLTDIKSDLSLEVSNERLKDDATAKDAHSKASFDEKLTRAESAVESQEPVGSNPFGNVSSPTAVDSNPFADDVPADALDEPPKASLVEPIDSLAGDKQSSSNPFDDVAESQPSATNVSTNPFEDDDQAVHKSAESITLESSKNPFEDSESAKASGVNPFEESTPAADESKNPFEDADDAPGSNPFEDDDDEQQSSFNRVGSFARKGSSRFAGSKRQKKRESKKNVAPAPPKPQRAFNDSQVEESVPEKTSSAAADSPRQKSKKDKKAPLAPPLDNVVAVDSSRGRSSSYNTVSQSTVDKRRDTDTGRMESVVNSIETSRQKSSPMVNNKYIEKIIYC